MSTRGPMVIYLTQSELDALAEYSCSVPTGVVPGTRWKRDEHAYLHLKAMFVGYPAAAAAAWKADYLRRTHRWWLGEYVATAPGFCTLRWSRIEIKSQPVPSQLEVALARSRPNAREGGAR